MADSNNSGVERDRQMLKRAHAAGPVATASTYLRLSGPGFFQSAITLGGGSLASALFLGVLGGTNLLWLQLVAITLGVIMLSAISYITLTTRERPFGMINRHINPSLGWGWLVATCMANIIWCMPQFSLCYEALDRNLVPGGLGESQAAKLGVSFLILAVTGCVLYFNLRGGTMAKVFDWCLKGLIATIVLCFFGVVIYLTIQGALNWARIFAGFVPDLSQWTTPAGDLRSSMGMLSDEAREFWDLRLVREQRAVMIGAAATAVGINMTFLMPYSLLQRGWDKTFRGLARFDLGLGMAIPYVLVTSCVVIAASQAFHGDPDDAFLSDDPEVFVTSPLLGGGARNILLTRVQPELAGVPFDTLSPPEQQAALEQMAALPAIEKRVASSLVRRDAFQLSQALEPLLGSTRANLVFGLGAFAMGFSTIIILMLINGFVFCEALGKPHEGKILATGCLVAGVAGALWSLIWIGPARLWLIILASSFGMMLLPIAYVTFFMLMNSKAVLGADRPEGVWRWIWNTLMGISVLGATIAAATAIYDKVTDHSSPTAELAGKVVLVVLVVYLVLVALGFKWKEKPLSEATSSGK